MASVDACDFIQYFIRLCHSLCLSGFLCWNCCASSGKTVDAYVETDSNDSGLFSRGQCLLSVCDLLARTMFAPTELSISTVTAFFGAPVVIFILLRRQKERN